MDQNHHTSLQNDFPKLCESEQCNTTFKHVKEIQYSASNHPISVTTVNRFLIKQLKVTVNILSL